MAAFVGQRRPLDCGDSERFTSLLLNCAGIILLVCRCRVLIPYQMRGGTAWLSIAGIRGQS